MERPRRRKLLVAGIGVAAVSYVVGTACNNNVTSGNLPAPVDRDGAIEPSDATTTPDQGVTSGNLPAPPPFDGGDAGDASDASDASDAADSSG